MYICVLCVCLLPVKRSEEGTGFPETGVCCLPPCEYWELNTGSLQEQKVLLTAESCLGPQCQLFQIYNLRLILNDLT